MLKYIALLFNTVALLIYQFFFAEGITVTQKIPASAKPETEFVVELTINKGSTSGFAKLQQDLPEGFTAVQEDNNGASFTFSNQSVKLIWMSLPADKEFKVKYKVKVAAGISGDKTIAGKFSYVADNVKQSIDISPATINIEGAGASQPVVTTTSEPTNTNTTANTTTSSTSEPTNTTTTTATNTAANTTTNNTAGTTTTTSEPVTTNTTSTEPVTTNTTSTQEPSSIACVRKITNKSATESIIEIIVNKGNASGFAKLLETIPAGCTAALNEAQGASFSFADGKAKFVWVSMPSQPEFKISYKVTVSTPAPNYAIEGVFSYIENDETKKYVLPSMPLSQNASEPVVTNTTTTTTTPENTTTTTNNTTTTTPNNTTTTEPVVNTTAQTNTNNTSNNSTSASTNTDNQKAMSATTIPAPQTGSVSYKVQIAALQNAVNANTLAARYGINEKISTEMADGFTKYTVGAHTEYKSARDSRETIKNKGVAGPFVTAYNSGKRITVQEALMISSQKWYR